MAFFGRCAHPIFCAKVGENFPVVFADSADLLAHLVAHGFTECIWDGLGECLIDGSVDVFLQVEDNAVGIVEHADVGLFDRSVGGHRMITWVGPFFPCYGAVKSIYLLGHYHANKAMLRCLGARNFFELCSRRVEMAALGWGASDGKDLMAFCASL